MGITVYPGIPAAARRTATAVIAAVMAAVMVAVVAAAVVAAAVFTTGGYRDGSAVAQAVAVERLLDAGAGSRVRLASAVDLVTRCVRLDTAVAELAATGEERLAQRRLLEFLDLSRLERGPRAALRNQLRDALLRSADTDSAFLGWARARQANGCDGDGVVGVSDEAFARARRVESTYRDAMRAGDTSTAAKRVFLDSWNPIASSLGLRIWTESGI